jgi:nitroimidazol reductase NimA-like FMN-containing flavoprotein (pyridoxamine 5'-phosphate oxidase superfamily)
MRGDWNVPSDATDLDVLTRTECIQLLSGMRIGRLGLSVSALPVVLPVNFAILNDFIVVRTGAGTKLEAAISGSVVAFEVGDVDENTMSGWSVLVQGIANPISTQEDLDRARSLDLRRWGDGPKDHFVRISTDIMSGRRILPRPTAQH